MAKERFERTSMTCPKTGAVLVKIKVKVKDKDCYGTRRLFESEEQVAELSRDDLLKRVNYAEDLLARAEITSSNTDNTGKAAKRLASREHWKLNDKATFMVYFLDESHTDKEIDARLDAYYDENLAE